jgi:MATE family multidrug resistance protein
MPHRNTVRAHVRSTIALGLPLVGSHLAQFAVTMTDTLMLGWYDVGALAAATLATSIFFAIFILGAGFPLAVMPLAAQAVAAGDERRLRRVTRMGLWWSVIYSALLMPLLIFSEPVLRAMGQPEKVAEDAALYLQIGGWALFPALLTMVLKSYFSALERTRVVLWGTVAAAVANAGVNWLLIFGHYGFPEWGIAGAAVASILTQSIMLLILIVHTQHTQPQHALFRRLWRPDRESLGEVFRLGLPMGLTNLAEIGLFSGSSVMMGWLGTIPLAAHGVALQLSSAAFMVHLGLSNAATVRAGHALGRRDVVGLRLGGMVAMGLSVGVALVTMVILLAVPELLLGAFVGQDDPARPEIILAGTSLLAVAAIFQLTDGAQVIALGLLRGVQDARVPMFIAAFTYWVIGLGSSYLFGFRLGYGGVGVWLGLVAGLAAAALLLNWRFWTRTDRLPQLVRADAV